MRRSIKTLRTQEGPPTDAEIEAAARQFVRKGSGYRIPSATNRAILDLTVTDVTSASRRLLDGLVVGARSPNRA
jgi:hypothetical protein